MWPEKRLGLLPSGLTAAGRDNTLDLTGPIGHITQGLRCRPISYWWPGFCNVEDGDE
jgi:hypothetical protein